jgi:RNA polymerase sigma-70 factor (ECF subfamily)
MNLLDIYHKYYEGVRKFIFSLVKDEWVADDLIQETFIKVQRNRKHLREESKISSWIFKIAYNTCQDHFRKMRQLSKNENNLSCENKILSGPLFEKKLEQYQMGECIQEKIRLLPESYQAVLVLFDLMEFSHQEIAQILDLSVENVKVRLHRARKKLKKILEEKCRFEVDERNIVICDPVVSNK